MQYLAVLQMFCSTATIHYHPIICLILSLWCTGSFICKGEFRIGTPVQETWGSKHPLMDITFGLKIGSLK